MEAGPDPEGGCVGGGGGRGAGEHTQFFKTKS